MKTLRLLLVTLIAVVSLSGCTTMGYYGYPYPTGYYVTTTPPPPPRPAVIVVSPQYYPQQYRHHHHYRGY